MSTVAIFPLILVKKAIELQSNGAYCDKAHEKLRHRVLPVICRPAPNWLHCGKTPLKFVTNVHASIAPRQFLHYNSTIYVDDNMTYVFPD